MYESKLLPLSPKDKTSVLSIAILAMIFGMCIFVAGFDNGQIIELVFAESGIDPAIIHELTHDTRHAAGFPCH